MDYERIARILISVVVIAIFAYVMMDSISKIILVKVAEGKL